MYKQGFDHLKSNVVGVRQNVDGEFVQVWSAPFKTPGRKLILTYQRNGTDVSSVSHHVYPEGGEYSQIVITDSTRLYYYREHERKSRYERVLSTGKVIVNDDIGAMSLEYVFSEDFNFETLEFVNGPLEISQS